MPLGLLAYPRMVIELPLLLLTDMLEMVRLAARGRDGPAAANELSSIAAGPEDWGINGVLARNLNVRVTDGNMVVCCWMSDEDARCRGADLETIELRLSYSETPLIKIR